MVESSALLKRRTPKGYRGFESLPHRFLNHTEADSLMYRDESRRTSPRARVRPRPVGAAAVLHMRARPKRVERPLAESERS